MFDYFKLRETIRDLNIQVKSLKDTVHNRDLTIFALECENSRFKMNAEPKLNCSFDFNSPLISAICIERLDDSCGHKISKTCISFVIKSSGEIEKTYIFCNPTKHQELVDKFNTHIANKQIVD